MGGERDGEDSPVVWDPTIRLLQHDFDIRHLPIDNTFDMLLGTNENVARGAMCNPQ